MDLISREDAWPDRSDPWRRTKIIAMTVLNPGSRAELRNWLRRFDETYSRRLAAGIAKNW